MAAAYSQSHICQCFSHLAALGSDSPLTICGNRHRTGKQFVDEVLRLASGLTELGVQPGDVVAISALNSDWYLEWLLAVAYVGGIVAPLNYRWSLDEYKYALAAVRPVMLVVDETLRIDDVLMENIPSIRWHVFIGSHPPPHLECKTGAMKFLDENIMKSEAKKQAPITYTWGPEGAAIICFTSGTSGRPKGAIISHNALMIQSMAKLDIVGYSKNDVYLHTASLCHIGGISSALAMLMAGARHIIPPKFESEKALKLIEDHQVTSFITVPAMLSDLISAFRGKTALGRMTSVKKILNGGGSLQGDLIKDASKYFPMAKIQSAYGMTEGCSSLTFLTLYDQADATPNIVSQFRGSGGTCVGKPAPHVELKICAENNSSHIGKIFTRGPHLMLRYYDRSFRTITNDQTSGFWHDTGDIGYLDEDGNLWLIGRTSGRIKSGGENIFPEEVEAVLLQQPGVENVVVIGVPDGRLGEMVVACVHLRKRWRWDEKNVTEKSDEKILSQNKLRHYCKDLKLTGFKIPKHFVCWDKSFPVTATGKVIRDRVRAAVVSSCQVFRHSSL